MSRRHGVLGVAMLVVLVAALAGAVSIYLVQASKPAATKAGGGSTAPASARTPATNARKKVPPKPTSTTVPASLPVLSVPPDQWCPPPTRSEIASLQVSFEHSHPGVHPQPIRHRLLLVGDSTACTLLPGLVAVGPYYGLEVEDAAVIGCGVISDRIAPFIYFGKDINAPSALCQSKAVAAEESGVVHGRPDIVLWSSAWERDPLQVEAGTSAQVEASGSSAWTSTLVARFDQRLALLTSTGAKVVLLEQPPFVDLPRSKVLTADDEEFLHMNALLARLAATHPTDVTEVDLGERVCPSGPPCPLLVTGLWIRGDGEHYFSSGAVWVAEWLFPRVLAAVGAG